MIPERTVAALKKQIDDGESPFILDVRGDDEYAFANLGGTLIPLPELPHRLDELEPHKDEEIIVMCRSGGRSAQAVQFLRARGFNKAINLRGGILAWSDQVDPSVPKY